MSVDVTRLIESLQGLSTAELARLDPAVLEAAQAVLADEATRAQQEWPITYYVPASAEAARIHTSVAREVAAAGGNRSSKTTSALAELTIQLTGHVPESLKTTYPREKLRPPIRARVVGTNLKLWFTQIFEPKMQWSSWNGPGAPGSAQGHYGFIPKALLRHGSWAESWREKIQTLHVAVDNFFVRGGSELETREWSSLDVMSNEQDVEAFKGPSRHLIVHDEIPREDIYRENRLRTLDVKGQILTAFTPPDEVGEAQARAQWFYEAVYEKGLPGPSKDPDIDSVTLFTESNRVLDADAIAQIARGLTPQQRDARLYGRFIHLSGVILDLFSDVDAKACLRCDESQGAETVGAFHATCPRCGSPDLVRYCHVVEPYRIPPTWPVVMTMDPHPRKPAAIAWFAVRPDDDIVQCGTLEAKGTAEAITRQIQAVERANGWLVASRIMDAKMASQGNNLQQDDYTNRDGFDAAGLRCALADHDMTLGIDRMRRLLAVDPATRRPRFTVFRTCSDAIASYKRWTWGEWVRAEGKEPKERVAERGKDFADTFRFFANAQATYRGLVLGLAHRAYRPPRGAYAPQRARGRPG